MGWRHTAGIGLLSCAALAAPLLVGCATGSDDSGTFDGGMLGTDPDAQITEAGDGGSKTDTSPMPVTDSSTPDTAKPTDSGSGQADSTALDSGTGIDSTVVDSQVADTGIPDVIIPDVAVPPGTTTCDYLASGSNFAKYIAECLIVQSSGSLCSGGCSASDCCGALCQNSSNQAVCLLK